MNMQTKPLTLRTSRGFKEMILNSKISYERIGGVLLCVSILSTLLLGLYVHSAFFIFQIGIAGNLVQSSITEKCFVKSILIKIGFQGEKDLGREESENQN